ncbi:MAG: single-stranded DNA-binding protein [Oscillospiraceae bacterium]|nr:single-stranded DNA-binding protein [Oscillospiraceae bacterium]
MYNRVILMGRLTRDPELRTTQSGVSMCRFSIAVERSFARQGEERQTDFFDITCWRQQAEFVCKYFTKGRMIHVEGTLQNNNYTDKDGVKHYSMAIQADRIDFCGDSRNSGGGYNAPGQYNSPAYDNAQQYQQSTPAPAPARPAAPQAAVNQAPNPIELGDLGDFEEILSDGEVPF